MAMHGDSVSRDKFGMAMGSLTEEDVRCLARLWPEALRLLRSLGEPGVRCARSVIEEWAAGVRVLGKRPETSVASRAEVPRMLEQVLEVCDEPRFLHWVRGIAREHALRRGDPGGGRRDGVSVDRCTVSTCVGRPRHPAAR